MGSKLITLINNSGKKNYTHMISCGLVAIFFYFHVVAESFVYPRYFVVKDTLKRKYTAQTIAITK